jgi:hypothetical protein
MKKSIFILLFVVTTQLLFGQVVSSANNLSFLKPDSLKKDSSKCDVIIMKNGDTVFAKVTEINPDFIHYKLCNMKDSPAIVELRKNILIIKFANGLKQVFSEPDKAEPVRTQEVKKENPFPNENLFIKGQIDASKYYVNYKGAGTVTLVISLLSPLVGLVPAIACSATPPRQKNLGFQRTELFQNPDYSNGFSQRAKKIKSRKVWTNWGIAFGVNVVLTLILLKK